VSGQGVRAQGVTCAVASAGQQASPQRGGREACHRAGGTVLTPGAQQGAGAAEQTQAALDLERQGLIVKGGQVRRVAQQAGGQPGRAGRHGLGQMQADPEHRNTDEWREFRAGRGRAA